MMELDDVGRLKYSLESERLVAMLKPRRSSGKVGMMGQGSGGHKKLFYSFNLDDHIPSDHLLRGIGPWGLTSCFHRHVTVDAVSSLEFLSSATNARRSSVKTTRLVQRSA
jgi:hypothetical protein